MQVRAALVDWTQPYTGPTFDVVLACDVLYEVWLMSHRMRSLVHMADNDKKHEPCVAPQDFSVEPVGALLPQMCANTGGRVLLADPTARTRHNRYSVLTHPRIGCCRRGVLVPAR